MSEERTCEDCMFCFLIDFGYSNYTTEGTTFHCGIGKHPQGELDRWYGEDDRLKYAQQCEYFAAGEPIKMDVDRENEDHLKMPLAQWIVWKRFNKRDET